MKLQKKFIAIVLFFICFNGFSQVNVTANFRIQTNLPIDTRMVVSDLTSRDAVSNLYRYEGMLVYVISDQTNYQLVGGIANANWQSLLLSSSGYTAGLGLTLSGNSFSHSSHTGDVTGTTSLTITAIQGRTLATVSPTSGDVLTWNGSAWAPTVALGTQYASGTGIIQSGTTFLADNTLAIWNANQLNGTSISTLAPASNEILKWNGTEWIPAADNNTTYTSGTGIVLAGNTFSANNTSAIWNANQLNGTSISTIAPTSNEILKWNGSEWIPAVDNNTTYTSGTGISLSGNTFSANNTSAIWNANQLNGTSISTIAPTSNEILKWNGTEWSPAADNNTTYASGTGISLTGNTFSANNTSAIWNANKLNGTSISTVGPSNNQILKWNGSEWIASDEVAYAAGTGLTLTGTTFLANNSSAIWNANKIMGAALSTTLASTNGQVLKWNSVLSEWEPGTDNVNVYSAGTGLILTGTTFSISGPIDVNLGGTGQTTFSDGQILIGNSSGTLTKNTISAGSDISITNGDGSITVTNTNPNLTHTGDAIGSSTLTVVRLQGRNVTTAIPSNGDVLTWDNSASIWKPSQASSSGSYNGNRSVKRSDWPININMGTSSNVSDFLDAVFFPFVSASISIDGSVLYEVGTSNSVNISGSTTAADETVFSNGRVDQTFPSTSTIYSFGAATSYSTSVTYNPDQSIPSSLEYRYVAYQTVGNNGSPITINSSTKYLQSCYPFLHGVSSVNLTTGGTTTYTGVSGKIVASMGSQTVTLNGQGYIYFCFPSSYGSLTSILDHNGFEQLNSFNKTTISVSSTGLPDNWSESYNIYQSNNTTIPTNWSYHFNF